MIDTATPHGLVLAEGGGQRGLVHCVNVRQHPVGRGEGQSAPLTAAASRAASVSVQNGDGHKADTPASPASVNVEGNKGIDAGGVGSSVKTSPTASATPVGNIHSSSSDLAAVARYNDDGHSDAVSRDDDRHRATPVHEHNPNYPQVLASAWDAVRTASPPRIDKGDSVKKPLVPQYPESERTPAPAPASAPPPPQQAPAPAPAPPNISSPTGIGYNIRPNCVNSKGKHMKHHLKGGFDAYSHGYMFDKQMMDPHAYESELLPTLGLPYDKAKASQMSPNAPLAGISDSVLAQRSPKSPNSPGSPVNTLPGKQAPVYQDPGIPLAKFPNMQPNAGAGGGGQNQALNTPGAGPQDKASPFLPADAQVRPGSPRGSPPGIKVPGNLNNNPSDFENVHSPFLPRNVPNNGSGLGDAAQPSPRVVAFTPHADTKDAQVEGMKTAVATWNYDSIHPDELSFKVCVRVCVHRDAMYVFASVRMHTYPSMMHAHAHAHISSLSLCSVGFECSCLLFILS